MNRRSQAVELKQLLDQTSWAARLARSLVGPEGAEDLLQEAWVQTLAHPPAATIESPRAWLTTILRRGAARKWRARGRRAEREHQAAREEALPSTHTLRAREEDRRILVGAVLDLPETMREPLVLCYFDELSPKEIAERLGVPPSTVRSRLQRGLAELRERLERERGEDWRVWCLGIVPGGVGVTGVTTPKWTAGKVALAILALAAVLSVSIALWPADSVDSTADGNDRLAGSFPSEAPGREIEVPLVLPVTDDDREAIAATPVPSSEGATVLTDPRVVYVLRGLCLDEAKQPVAGLRAVAADLFGTPSATSGADGRLALPIVAPTPLTGPWQGEPTEMRARAATLLFEGERHRAGGRRVELGAEREIDLGRIEVITAPRSVRGRVLNGAGLPVGGAFVYLLRDFELGPDEAELARCAVFSSMIIHVGAFGFVETEPDGRFQLGGVPAGAFRLSIFSNGHDGLLTESLDPELGERMDLGNLQLEPVEPERSSSGRVVTAAGDEVPHPWVFTRCSTDGGQSFIKGPPIVGDADGRFQVSVPAGARCGLRVESDQGSARTAEVEAGTHDLFLVLEPTPEVEPPETPLPPLPRVMGKVSLEGRGVPGARITAWKIVETGAGKTTVSLHASAESGAKGRFVIAAPDEGTCRLRADFGPWNEPLLAEWGPFEPQPDEEQVEARLELRAAGSIAGELTGAGAAGSTGTTVRAYSEGRPTRTATVGAAMTFRFDSLPPGEYRLVREVTGTASAEEPIVQVMSGATAEVRFDLADELPGRLLGRIVVDGKRPRGTWRMTIVREKKYVDAPSLDQQGSFVAEPLEPGWLSLTAFCQSHPPRYFHKEMDIVVGENHLDIDVSTGRLELTDLPLPDEVDLSSGNLAFTTCLTWEGPDGLKWGCYPYRAKKGALTVKQVPAGTVRLHHQEKGTQNPEAGPVIAEIVVRAGETTTFVFPSR